MATTTPAEMPHKPPRKRPAHTRKANHQELSYIHLKKAHATPPVKFTDAADIGRARADEVAEINASSY